MKKANETNITTSKKADESGTKLSNGSTCLYKTQGMIAGIDLIGRSFTIDPVSPYAFEQKKGDNTEKSILFVAEAEDKVGTCRDAKILAIHQIFALPEAIDLGTAVAIKNGRDKIELGVNSFVAVANATTKEDNLKVVSLEIQK